MELSENTEDLATNFKFTTYHEPLNRWPNIPDPLAKKIRAHGSYPTLLMNHGRMRGVVNQRKSFRVSPSERIGSNFSPTAKELTVASLRSMRIQRKKITSQIRAKPTTSLPRIHRYLSEEKTIGSQSFIKMSTTSRSFEEDKVSIPTDKGRIRKSHKIGLDLVSEAGANVHFMERFPYKSCRRLCRRQKPSSTKKVSKVEPLALHWRKKHKKEASHLGETTTIKFQHPSCLRKPVEASLPSSPTLQLKKLSLARRRKELEASQLSSDEISANLLRYKRYIESMDNTEIGKLQKKSMDRIKDKLKPSLIRGIMMRKHFQALMSEVSESFDIGLKTSILNYVLMDEEERDRLNIHYNPERFMSSIVRAPVPWHQSFITAKQFCRHNLFVTNPILLRLVSMWSKRYNNLRFVTPSLLSPTKEPLSPLDLQRRVYEQCEDARAVLEKRWLPEVALVFVSLRQSWRHLIPMKKSDSLKQIHHFFNCVATLMSQQVRSMALSSLKSFVEHIKTHGAGNDFEGSYSDNLYIMMPMLTLSLKAANQTVGFSPSLGDTKEIIMNCLQEIVMSTKEFPRVESKLFPELKQKQKHLLSVSWEEDQIQDLANEVLRIFEANTVGPAKYIKIYTEYDGILSGQAEAERDKFLERNASLEEFEVKMNDFSMLRSNILKLRNSASLNLIALDCVELNKRMTEQCEELHQSLINFQVEKNRSWNRSICNQFDQMATKLGVIPDETKALVDLQSYLKMSMTETMPILMKKIARAMQRIRFLLDYTILPTEDIQLNTRVFQWPADMKSVFELAEKRTGDRRDQVEEKLRTCVDKFEIFLKKINRDLESFVKKDPPVLTMDEMKTCVQMVDRLESKTREAVKQLKLINTEEMFLDWDPSQYPLLDKIQGTVALFSSLWHVALDFHEKYERWYNGPLKGLDSEEIQEQVEEMYEKTSNLSRTLMDFPSARRISETIRSKIEKFRVHLPILHTLCNPGLRSRHWDMISQANGGEAIVQGPETSLCDMIDAGLSKIVSQLEEIGSTASKEYALESNLKRMKFEWESVEFECESYRETGVSILTGVEDIQQMLDDHILKAQTMHSSSYIKPFEEEMKSWEEKLLSMQDILDAWIRCQESWLYLEPIFNSEDIMKQMPVEGRKFNKVDRTWRNIMAKTVADPRVLKATSQPNMLKSLQDANELLDAIMKGLNDYLEKKRVFFPRFFFLSNDELLEILSETKDPLRVQPHIKKCFEGIELLKFQTDKFGNQDIVGMISSDGEEVEFSATIFPSEAKGMVEKWLVQVEKQMIYTLKEAIADALKALYTKRFQNWISDWPGQAVMVASAIKWTSDVTKSIEGGDLNETWEDCKDRLADIVCLVQDSAHDEKVTKTLQAMIIILVHSRDVVEKVINENVSDVSDFGWQSNMRYYLPDIDDKDIFVEMVATRLSYAFEYLGNTSRLVMTPLTVRCFRTLMGALNMNLGGAPEGPAGSGKTETCKDLAKAVAKQCIVFNCSDGLDHQAMGKFLKGLAQSGAWACFDEFNRIEIDVLSVVAHQIHTIQTAIISQAKTFMFEGVQLTLNPSCAIFITMNPSSESSNQIPDNLRHLFRPVATMLPDVAMITQVSLYAMGFQNARVLAKKIVETYRLCTEHLSYQHHYDYGMRAVRAVLSSAQKLRIKTTRNKQDNGLEEYRIILRSLRDINLPKFVSSDIETFQNILRDMFPEVSQLDVDRNLLRKTIQIQCDDSRLQPTEWFVSKVIQLYELILVNHGIMIVGHPMSCKTECFHILAEALTSLSESRHEKRTEYKIINPKSVSMSQLYGRFDPKTREWSDGIIGKTFRDMSNAGQTSFTSTDQTPEQNGDCPRSWIVFDGPVDSAWIENLNTVLDDSKKLCLMNGEIMSLDEGRMNIIFEVSDLRKASPAVVSRCGVLYMESHLLGWRPLVRSFVATLPKESFDQDRITCLNDMFSWLVPPCLKHISESELFFPFSELHLVRCQLSLFASLLGIRTEGNSGVGRKRGMSSSSAAPAALDGDHSDVPEVDFVHMQMAFLFSILWGLGCTLTENGRRTFDSFFRNLIDGLMKGHAKPTTFKLGRTNLIPEHSNIFNYTLDFEKPGSWVKWADQVPSGQFAGDNEVLIVPTAETVKQSFFLELALSQQRPLVLVGKAGTGKSFVTNSFIRKLSKEKFITNVINFSARTSVTYTQDVIMSKLDRRRKGVFGPAMGKRCVVFVDDLNLPNLDASGSIPAVELLRQWIDHGYWYDKKDRSKMELMDILLLTAMSPPGSGRNEISTRFLRHLNILSIDTFTDETLKRIFTAEIGWHFKQGYELPIHQMTAPLGNATLQLYKSVLATFLPTPTKSHYMFDLRDFSRVVKGIRLVPNSHLRDPNKLIRLWCHEVYRVFYDRLVDDFDRQIFFTMVKNHCQSEFKVDLSKILFPHVLSGSSVVNEDHLKSICFGDFMHPESDKKIYDEVPDATLLTKAMEHYLKEYNSLSKAPVPLVMFKYAVEHTTRINRIIKQKGGHALLVGLSGSGRQSLAKLATFIARYDIFQIEVNKAYNIDSWRNDLKKVLKKAGAEGREVVFLLNDVQLKDESFLEDISMILNTGDVPNLFLPEEKAEILERIQTSFMTGRDMSGEGSFANLYSIFLQNVKRNLHIILCMSPIGNALRVRLRMFPSLVHCCTIDWFDKWPEDALHMVADKFLLDIDEETKVKSISMCVHFHRSAEEAARSYAREQRRFNYITPTSYLALIDTFKRLLKGKSQEFMNLKTRYEMGLNKLEFASSQVTAMQNELTALKPQLLETSHETERLMIKIEQDTIQVEAKKEIVACDEALANEAAAAAQAIRDDCENDLAEAIPALQSAVNALNTLDPSDITVVKTMKNPAPIVKYVVEAVCIMKGVAPERKPDPENQGRLIDDYWTPGQKMMGDIRFLDTLRAYDKDNIPPAIMKRIRENYVTNPYFDPNLVKKVSTACEGLCKWVRAIEVYDRVIKIVSPKKAKLAEAETELANQMDKLNEKRAQLQQVTDKLQALNDEFAAMTKKKKDLEDNIELCSQKLSRAEKLIRGLGGEKARWNQMAETLGSRLFNVTGDVLLSAATIAYLGAFDIVYRKMITNQWKLKCSENDIRCSDDFSISNTLGDPVEIRHWQIAGLPKDNFSTDNGVVVANSTRWPLMIDPQGQASKWVKNLEKGNNLVIIRYTDPDYVQHLQNAIANGKIVVLENNTNEIDPGLECLLLKQTFEQNGVECVLIGDQVIEYNPSFKLYIVTNMHNPHYSPEISVKVTLLNFIITREGLQEQLLGILAAEEKPQLEEMKNKLILEGATNRKLLKEIEDKILKVLSASQGNILEDETAIQILSSSKVLSEEIAAKQKVASETEAEIDKTRNGYSPVAEHSAILFFCIGKLSNIDPMYQFSMPWFIELYYQAIRKCKDYNKLDEHINALINTFTTIIYRKISQSLFHKHILVFSFILCHGILKGKGKVEESVWNFLLTGGLGVSSGMASPPEHSQPNPHPEWISQRSWDEIVRASGMLLSCQGLKESIRENSAHEWKNFVQSSAPHMMPMPGLWNRAKSLERLVILRCLRPDCLLPGIRQFVRDTLGSNFTQIPQFSLVETYQSSDRFKPIIMILGSGADPLAAIKNLRSELDENPTNVEILSLGQGQGTFAEQALLKAAETGSWIVLQNCHLALRWMETLANVWEEDIMRVQFTNGQLDGRITRVHKSFRLWLTSNSTRGFPASLLLQGVKVTLEAPGGLKSTLRSVYSMKPITDDSWYGPDLYRVQFRRLVFGLCLFHGVAVERRDYGPIGWHDRRNKFENSDLIVSLEQLRSFLIAMRRLSEEELINALPMRALQYLIAECNYGGRVTDVLDRRLLKTLLQHYFNNQLAIQKGYKLSDNLEVPLEVSRSHCSEVIEQLPEITPPEHLGLNQNAAAIKTALESKDLLKNVIVSQNMLFEVSVEDLAGDDSSQKVLLAQIRRDMAEKIPKPFDIISIESRFPSTYENSFNMILRLEAARYNLLLEEIRTTMSQVEQALSGKIVMSPETEEVFSAILQNKVPNVWLQVSYPSMKQLRGYLHDLRARCAFLSSWIKTEVSPNKFWLAGFYFPHSFLTAAKQNFARSDDLKKNVSQINLKFTPLFLDESSPGESSRKCLRRSKDQEVIDPETLAFSKGTVIDGLFIQGGRWDQETKCLEESFPNTHFSKLPPILLEADIEESVEENGFYFYECPLFQTEERRGDILSTGHSTNFICMMNLRTTQPPDHWIKRGVAAILQISEI